MNFATRIEARVTIPAGGVTVSAVNTGGANSATVAAGTYFITELVAALVAALNATAAPSSGAWSGSVSKTGTGATGRVTLNCTGTWWIVWNGDDISGALGFTADIVGATTAQTGAAQSTMLWFPDCPLGLAGDPQRAPLATDHRAVMTPLGQVYALVGTSYRRHTNLTFAHVARARTWEAVAAIANASWEAFVKNTQLRQGSSWFPPSAPVKIYDETGAALGVDASIASWQMLGITGTDLPTMAIPGFVGLWQIVVPTVVAVG